ncbi:MAG: hypothetical protein ACREVI_12550 [Steroidobacteraceae bacterium]
MPTCRSVIDGTDTACVPWNPFIPNGVTQEQLNYIQVRGLQIGRISQEIYNGSVNGDLGAHGVKTPWASDGVQLILGSECRRDALDNKVDAHQEANNLSGAGGARIGIGGASKVNELFFEALAPLVQDRAMLESLSFDTAYRFHIDDTIATFGQQNTWTACYANNDPRIPEWKSGAAEAWHST